MMTLMTILIAGSARGGMTPEIMRPQIDTRKLASLFDHHTSCIVSDWEYPLFSFNPFILDVFSKTVCYFLRNENDFGFPATFRVRQCNLLVFDINGSDFGYITESHSTLGHRFQHYAVTGTGYSKNDFINRVFFDDFQLFRTAGAEYFYKNGGFRRGSGS